MYSPYAQPIDLVPDMHNNPNYYLPDQSGYNACQTFAGGLALEVKHSRAGLPITVNRPQTYRGAQLVSLAGQVINNGASVANVAQTWATLGVPTNTSFYDMYSEPTPAEAANAAQYMGVVIDGVPYIRSGPAMDNTIETIHMLLDRGEPIIATFRLTQDFDWYAGNFTNWRETDWDASYATGGPSRGDHVVTLLGIDMVAQRVLAANHWGEGWGDGGFFGIPFEKFVAGPQGCVTQLHYIKNCAVSPMPTRILANTPPTSLTLDQQQQFDNFMKGQLATAFGNNADWPAALMRAVALKLTPAQFELYAPVLGGLPAGTVRNFIDQGYITDPGFEWNKTYGQMIAEELATAFGPNQDNWVGLLTRAVALKQSDKQFEMYAPTPGGLPRGVVREFVDRGDITDPGFRWELTA